MCKGREDEKDRTKHGSSAFSINLIILQTLKERKEYTLRRGVHGSRCFFKGKNEMLAGVETFRGKILSLILSGYLC